MIRSTWAAARSRGLPIAVALACVALVAASVSLAWVASVSNGREADRISSDVAGCQRGNQNRARASEQIRNVVVSIAVYTGASDDETAALLDAIKGDLEPTVTDCSAVVPGAAPDAPDFPAGG